MSVWRKSLNTAAETAETAETAEEAETEDVGKARTLLSAEDQQKGGAENQ